jgi:hypothetical protein
MVYPGRNPDATKVQKVFLLPNKNRKKIMKILYQAILDAFSRDVQAEDSVFAGYGVEPPNYIDLYDGQPEAPDQFEFMCPAIFIDYAIAWQKNGAFRVGALMLTVHVLTDATPDTDNISARLSEGLKKIDYCDAVVDLLDGLETEETSGLTLTDERPVATDYFNYRQLKFTCNISRKIKRNERYVDGTIEGIPIAGNPVKRFDLD